MIRNRIIAVAIMFSMSLGLVGPVLAHNDKDDDDDDDQRNEISILASGSLGVDFNDLNQLRREEDRMLKDLGDIKKEQRKEEKEKKRLSKTWKKVEKKISRIISGQEKVAVKLDDRLDIMASSSINVADLRTKLSNAVSLINASKTALTDASVKASASIQTQINSDSKTTLRGLINGLKDKIKLSHQALVDVMFGIKVKLAVPTSTPTPTPTPTP